VWRALGVLRTARMISSDEFVELYSQLRLGVAAGQIKGVTLDALSELSAKVQPATMLVGAGRALTPAERDARRADMIRETLGE